MLPQRFLFLTATLLIVGHSCCANGQIFDQMFRPRGEYTAQASSQTGSLQQPAGVHRNPDGSLGINIPIFYDMIRNGNNLGINVLSGLVKVERGSEAERSGLSGPRPLSVRVFGIPVYERGTRLSTIPEGEGMRPAGGEMGPSGDRPEPMNPAEGPQSMGPAGERPELPEGPDGPVDP